MCSLRLSRVPVLHIFQMCSCGLLTQWMSFHIRRRGGCSTGKQKHDRFWQSCNFGHFILTFRNLYGGCSTLVIISVIQPSARQTLDTRQTVFFSGNFIVVVSISGQWPKQKSIFHFSLAICWLVCCIFTPFCVECHFLCTFLKEVGMNRTLTRLKN